MTMTTTTRLSDRFAARTGVFGDSIWTDILTQLKKHEDPVYFGDGAPASEIMPVDRLREASVTAWDDAPFALSYGDQQGYAPLRDLVAARIAARGIEITGADVLITQGSTQAIDLACRVFFEPGDAIIVEKPTFLGALEIFRLYGVEIVAVDLDEQGMRMDALEDALRAHPNAKAIYTIPTFQNPTGTSLPLDRRYRMIELAREHTVAIFEDDPYGELQYSGEAIAPLRSLDAGVIHLGTFSKTIAPGIRTGFAIASPDVMVKMLGIRESTDISNDRIMMRTVYHAASDFLDDHVSHALEFYRPRRDAMLAALDEHMPDGITWSRPDGGFFVWISLPDHLDAHEIFERGADNGVIAFPGEWFYPHREVRRDLRFSFSTVPEDRIRLGIQRLGETLREALG